MFIVKWVLSNGNTEFFTTDYICATGEECVTIRFYSQPSGTEVIIDKGTVYIMNSTGKTIDQYWLYYTESE